MLAWDMGARVSEYLRSCAASAWGMVVSPDIATKAREKEIVVATIYSLSNCRTSNSQPAQKWTHANKIGKNLRPFQSMHGNQLTRYSS